ncbi:MarR family winged helix-turn-helix transcriptional regulator [Nocardioides sp.]|uniref:MarR family winged helix-turn-helix transcriptional regulator n=1 Tax=Nocardioides sp. TaxID=35761 RepID=UPI00351240EB
MTVMSAPDAHDVVAAQLLDLVGRRVRRAGIGALRSGGVTETDHRVLGAVASHPVESPPSQVDLGRVTGLDRKEVAIAVARLEQAGSVMRRRDPADARRQRVVLTASGAERLSMLDRAVAVAWQELLAPLNATQRAMLVRLLTSVSETGAADLDETEPLVVADAG